MQKTFFIKIVSMAVIMGFLMVALAMIKGKIDERGARRTIILNEMADNHGGQQQISGPLIVMPCTQYVSVTGAQGDRIEKQDCTRRLTPKNLDIQGEITTRELKRGIYRTQVSHYLLTLSGRFEIPVDSPLSPEKPFLSIPLQTTSGLVNIPALQWNATRFHFSSGAGPRLTQEGVHAFLPITPGVAGEFSLTLEFNAGDEVAIAPVGDTTSIQLKSAWPHPSFSGTFLPQARTVSDDGFSSSWNINRFASNIPALVQNCRELVCMENPLPTARIKLITPVDVYLTSYRAAEYGWIVITIIFGLFFLMEILKNLRIHPAQYLMIGLSQALFFLLLFSAAEHIDFGRAFLIAAIACLTVNGIYAHAILPGWKATALFTGMSVCIFGFIYLVLNAEDFALLGGSILSMSLLAAAMVLTRNVDWYQVNDKMNSALQKRI